MSNSLLTGSLSFVRYLVQDELPGDFWDLFAARVSHWAFKSIDDSFEAASVGWVSVFDMFDSVTCPESCIFGDHVFLSMRVDERKIAASTLKKFCLKEQYRIRIERQIPKLSRNQKAEIRENVWLQLLRKTVPSANTYQLAWNLVDNTVLFFCTQPKPQVLLEDFFKGCFDLQLMLQVHYNIAEVRLDEAGQQALKDIEPAILV